jgi:drug/metabolite transporter (DMT)-like permease
VSTFKKALLQLHVFVFLAGLTGPLGFLIQLNGLMLVFYRMLLASLVLLFIYFFTQQKHHYNFATKFKLIGIGAIIALHWVCFYGSIKLANVSIALVCFSSTSMFTSLIEPLATKVNMKWRDILIGAISFIGILLIFHFDTKFRTGIIVGLLSALLASIFSVINKGVTNKVDTFTIQFYEMMGGVFFLSLIILGSIGLHQNQFVLPQQNDWFWIFILAIACTVWANHLMLSSLKHISAFTLNVTLNLEPVYGIILAFVLFKEQKQLGGSFYIGLGLIALSVLIQMLRIVKQHKLATKV